MKKLIAATLSLLMIFSLTTVMLHSLAENGANSTTSSSSSSSVEPKSSNSNEESSSSENSSKPSGSYLSDNSSSTVSSVKPDNSSNVVNESNISTNDTPYVVINQENFPDANFRQYLLDNTTYTTEGDIKYYTEDQIAAITKIDCSNKDISSLQGIEHFTFLTGLFCYNNQLTSLDVGNNTVLTYLFCYNNQLTSLDVGNNTVLTELYCSKNQLTSLDVGNNTALTYLSCDNNQLTNLDVSKNTALKTLYCSDNRLTSLDVRNNIALQDLYCYNNQLTSLDLTTNTKLTHFIGSRQNSKAILHNSSGKYTVDFNEVIPNCDINNVTIRRSSAGWTLNSETGIATYNNSDTPTNLNYDYSTGNGDNKLNVTLNLEIAKYTVTFDSNGGSAVENQTVTEGSKATKPDDPTKEGFTFAGWFTDENLSQELDFNTQITANITLYAKWNENKIDPSSDDSKGENTNNDQNSGNNAATNSTTTGQDYAIFLACLLTSFISVLSISKILNYRKKHQK